MRWASSSRPGYLRAARTIAAAAALVCLAAHGMFARTIAQSAGPTRIKIAAGTVTADDTRAGLLGVWTPEDDRGLPADATIVFESDGTFREQTLNGTYDFDAASGLLRRTNSGAGLSRRTRRPARRRPGSTPSAVRRSGTGTIS